MTDTDHPLPDLGGRAVIVTGGAEGAGRAMTLALLAAGASVAVTADGAVDALEALVEDAKAMGAGDRIAALEADVTIEAACSMVVRETVTLFGGVHGLVNNAALGPAALSEEFESEPRRFWEAAAGAWRRLIDVNLDGPFLMAHAAVPEMIARGGGAIVNISVDPEEMVAPDTGPYGPSKAALEAASLVWAENLRPHGISVNILLPGSPGPESMGPPVVWLMSGPAREATGRRYVAARWDAGRPPAQAAEAAEERGPFC